MIIFPILLIISAILGPALLYWLYLEASQERVRVLKDEYQVVDLRKLL